MSGILHVVNNGLLIELPTLRGQNGAAVVENGICNDNYGETLTSEVSNRSKHVLGEECIQNDERTLMTTGARVEFSNGSTASSTAIQNRGFDHDNEDAKEEDEFNVEVL